MNDNILLHETAIRRICLFVFFVCTFNALLQGVTSRTTLTILYLGLLIICAGLLLFQHRFFIRINGIQGLETWIVLLLIIWEVMAYFALVFKSDTTQLSLQNFLQTILPIFVFFIAVNLNSDICSKIELSFVVLSAVSVFIGVIDSFIHVFPQSWFGDELVGIAGVYFHRGYSMAGMSLGTGWICGISIGLLLYCKYIEQIKNVTFWILFCFLTLGNLLTFSRGGVFFELIILISYWLMNIRSSLSKNQFMIIMAAIIMAVLVIIINWDSITSSAFYQRYIISGLSQTEGSNIRRLSYQKIAVRNINSHPLFGLGFGHVGSAAWNLSIPGAYPTESYYYLLALDGGITGAVLFAVASLLAAVFAIKKGRDSHHYAAIIIGTMLWGLMMTVLEGDLCALVYWYCIGRVMGFDT